jgi:hypothetical protein
MPVSLKSFFLAIHHRFLAWGLMHESHRSIEKLSGYILIGSVVMAAIFLFLGGMSRFLLDGLFENIFIIGLKMSFFIFWVGALMVILSTNKII